MADSAVALAPRRSAATMGGSQCHPPPPREQSVTAGSPTVTALRAAWESRHFCLHRACCWTAAAVVAAAEWEAGGGVGSKAGQQPLGAPMALKRRFVHSKATKLLGHRCAARRARTSSCSDVQMRVGGCRRAAPAVESSESSAGGGRRPAMKRCMHASFLHQTLCCGYRQVVYAAPKLGCCFGHAREVVFPVSCVDQDWS